MYTHASAVQEAFKEICPCFTYPMDSAGVLSISKDVGSGWKNFCCCLKSYYAGCNLIHDLIYSKTNIYIRSTYKKKKGRAGKKKEGEKEIRIIQWDREWCGPDEDRPDTPEIVLVHEMIHVKRGIEGVPKKGQKNEESETVRGTNVIRREQGTEELRGHYEKPGDIERPYDRPDNPNTLRLSDGIYEQACREHGIDIRPKH